MILTHTRGKKSTRISTEEITNKRYPIQLSHSGAALARPRARRGQGVQGPEWVSRGGCLRILYYPGIILPFQWAACASDIIPVTTINISIYSFVRFVLKYVHTACCCTSAVLRFYTQHTRTTDAPYTVDESSRKRVKIIELSDSGLLPRLPSDRAFSLLSTEPKSKIVEHRPSARTHTSK